MDDEKERREDLNPEENATEPEEAGKQEPEAEEARDSEGNEANRPEEGPQEASSGTESDGKPEGASISAEEAAALEKGLDWVDSAIEDIPDIPDFEEIEKSGGGEQASQAALDELINSVKQSSGFNFTNNPSGGAEGPSAQPASFPDMGDRKSPEPEASVGEAKIEMLMDIPVQVTVVLGHAQKTIGEILALEQGAVVELDRIVGEPVDVLANGKLVFKGEVVVIDENFGVRVVELVKSPVGKTR